MIAESRDTGESDGCTTANFYQLQSPQVSSDGTVLVYTASRRTSGARICPVNEANQAVVQRLGIEVRLPGSIAISPNGRYAITTPRAAGMNNFHVVTDLVSGVSNLVAGGFNGSGRRVTDDATIVTAEASAVILIDRNGGTRVLQTTSLVDDVIIDRSGRTVVYETRLAPGIGTTTPGRIASIDVATGRETEVITGLFAPGNLSMTSNGVSVLFTEFDTSPGSGSQLYVIGIGGGVARPITHVVDQIGAVVVSGDGLVGYAVTGSAQLVRIDLTSGSVTELAPATPLLTAAYRVWPADSNSPGTTVAAVGSLMEFGGFGLGGIRQITLCGRSVPVSTSIFFPGPRLQVPWDLPEGPCQAIAQSDSPFEHAIDLNVRERDPQFEAGIVLHDDYRTITSGSPAHPGEVIVAYMTGLGPVDDNGEVKSGFSCSFDSAQGDILYAGLAPGLTGSYQVNIRVPNLHSSLASLFCGWDPVTRARATVWLGPF